MKEITLDRHIGDLTLEELRDIVRQVVREEALLRCRIGRDGSLIFLYEEDYAAYLAKQEGKLPSEVNACFIDEQGFTVSYADEVPTAGTRRRIERAKREIAVGKGLSLEEVRKNLETH